MTHQYVRVRYDSIQFLRGVACLLVILFHMHLQLNDYYGVSCLANFFAKGYGGVDLFFVISGFVIAHSSHALIGKPAGFLAYYRKRFSRIYPLYWIVLIPAILGVVLTMPQRIPVGDTGQTLAYWLNVATLLPGHDSINIVSWSLSHELYFYVLFSLLILTGRGWLLLAAVLLLTMVNMVYPVVPDALNFYVSPFNLEFFAGSLVWYVSVRIKPSFGKFIGAVLAACILAFLCHRFVTNEGHAERALVFGLMSTLIVFAFVQADQANGFSVQPLLLTIGNASYTLYLIHLPYMVIANKFIRMIVSTDAAAIALNIGVVISSVVLGLYVHKYVEKPLMQYFAERRSVELAQS